MSEQQFVVFRLQNEEYGLNIQQVNEILVWQEITKYPQAGDLIDGIINLRGKIIPLIDLKKRFYNKAIERTDNTRIIVVQSGEQVFGIIVDEVLEVLVLAENMIESPPEFVSRINTGVCGVGKLPNRLLILLDLSTTFSSGEFDLLKTAVN